MPATKLSETVSKTECILKHQGQEQTMETMQHQVDMMVAAIIGVPGNAEKPGLAGTYLLLNNRIDNIQKLMETVVTEQQKMALAAASKTPFPWLKIVSLVLAINTPIWIILGIILKTKGVL